MTKKFISLVLSLMTVIGMLTSFNAYAESTVYIDDGFETYSETAYNTDFSTTTQIYDTGDKTNYNHYWQAAKNMSLEIVDMPGLDGNMTKAAEVTVNSCAVSSNTDGSTRFQLTKSGLGTGTGVVVHEMDIYIDDNTMSNVYMTPIFIKGKSVGVGETQQNGHNTLKTVSNGWHHIMSVTILDGTEVNPDGTTNNNVIGYLDGECISYKGHYNNAAGRMFQVYGKSLPGYKTLTLDNVKLYANPEETVASAEYDGSESVPANAKIAVDFTNKLYKGKVGISNVQMSTSGGKNVELARVDLDADENSLDIETLSDFDKGETYTVTLTGLEDIYGRVIEDYTFSFTTADDNLIQVMEAPTFTKQYLFQPGNNSVEINALENGYISVSHNVRNNSVSRNQDLIVLCVLKENAEIKYFQFKNGTLAPGAELTFNGGFKIDNAEEQSIEVYVWDTMSGMTPLAEKYVITNDGITPSISE